MLGKTRMQVRRGRGDEMKLTASSSQKMGCEFMNSGQHSIVLYDATFGT